MSPYHMPSIALNTLYALIQLILKTSYKKNSVDYYYPNFMKEVRKRE